MLFCRGNGLPRRGGSAVESQSVLSGNPLIRPDSPVYNGFSFTGWYRDATATVEWIFATDRVTGNMTLYAGWAESGSLSPTESLVYERSGQGYKVVGVGQDTEIVIPAEYEGLPVVAIGRNSDNFRGAFANTGIVSVVIPDSVTEIETNAFYNASQLVSVFISENSNLTVIGNNAFSGCSALEALFIPANVRSIGNDAFNNCGSIEAFTVAEGNSIYRAENGHLIENATNTLLRGANNGSIPGSVRAIAPAAFRRANGITELYIAVSVTSIGNYFIADSTITKIAYAGTELQWNAIEKSDSWNYGNREVSVRYEQTANIEL